MVWTEQPSAESSIVATQPPWMVPSGFRCWGSGVPWKMAMPRLTETMVKSSVLAMAA
ncbi:hypothetical protein D3C72_1247930 [compost metagenome]